MWMTLADNISDICKIPLFDVFNLNIIEFLNMMSYLKYKNKTLEKEYKK